MADKGHTELPWSLNPHHPRLINGGPNHREVAKTSFGADGELAENTANAHLIVTAVNTYPAVEALVKALEDTLKFIESQMHYSQPSYDSGLEPSDQFTYDASPVACAAQDALSRFRSLQNGVANA